MVCPPKILLVNNPGTSELGYKAPSLGLYSIKHYLEKNGYDVTFVDMLLSNGDKHALLSYIRDNEFAIIGYSATDETMLIDIDILEDILGISEGKSWVIVGGNSPTCDHEQWLNLGIDAVVLGYGEYPMLELCKAWGDTLRTRNEKFSSIKGLAWRSEAETHVQYAEKMSKEQFVEIFYTNALEMDVPYDVYIQHNADKAKKLSYTNHNFVAESVQIYSMNQCPNFCGYCNSHTFLTYACGAKQPLMMLDAEQLYTLIIHNVNKYNAKRVSFFDDEFVASPRRVIDLCNKIIAAKNEGIISRDVVFCCQARVVDFLKEGKANIPLITAMKDAKFNHVSLGVESFNKKLLLTPIMNKHGYDGVTAFELLKTMKDIGLENQANVMLFVPESTREDILHDISYAIGLVEYGCAVAVTEAIFAFAGAPAYYNPLYRAECNSVHIQRTGQNVVQKRKFFALQSDMQKIIEAFPQALDEVIQEYSPETNVFARQLLGIMKLLAVSRLLKAEVLAKRCTKAIELELGCLTAH